MVGEICPKCGMPKELCICDTLEKEKAQKIKVYATKKKFKKLVTVIEGIDKKQIHDTAVRLKHRLACGGTVKDDMVILQGDHRKKVPSLLEKLGYPKDIIEVIH